jgi:hypothetical protein
MQTRIINAIISGYTVRKETQRAVGVKAAATFDTHIRRIYAVTGARDFTQIVIWAWKNGWQLPQGEAASGD